MLGETYLVALVDELMRPRYQLQTVDVVELGRHLAAKEPARPARTHRPRVNVLGIRPHEIAKGALVRDLLRPGDHPDLVDGADLGAEAAVDAEDLAVDDRREDEEVKDVAAGLPH